MRFIAKHTSIPVPKVYCAFTCGERTYIVMERIDGEMVGNGWRFRSAESQKRILLQLKQMVDEMRSLPAPGPGVANVDGGPLFEERIPGTSLRHGPFRNIQEFHKHLREGVESGPHFPPEARELIAQHDAPWPLPVMTHGDLSSLNILARGDTVVGIIDWETAGWYPYYWEYTSACQPNPRDYFWRDELDKFLDPMPEELAMEETRRKYWHFL